MFRILKVSALKSKKFKNRNINSQNIATIIILIFYAIIVAKDIGFVKISIGNYLVAFIGISSYLIYLFLKHKAKNLFNKESVALINYITVFVIIGVTSSLISGNFDINEQSWPIVYGAISLLLINFTLNDKYVSFALFFISFCFIAIMATGVSPNSFMKNVSENNISSFLLCFLCIYYISKFENDKNYSILPAVMVLLITVWTTSRNGLAASLCICLGILFVKKQTNAHKIRIMILSIIIIVALIVIFRFLVDLIPQLNAAFNEITSEGMKNGARENIWGQYLDSIKSTKDILVGPHIKDNYYFMSLNENLHASIFNLHSRYGLLGVIFVIFVIIKTLIKIIRKKKYVLLAILICLIVRGVADEFYFNGIADPILYYLFFSSYITQKNLRVN